MNDFDNRNDRQLFFNQIKGSILELNIGEIFCNITLNVGHESIRQVNLISKRPQYDELIKTYSIGDKISVKFYITSRYKNGKWYTTANLLSVEKN